MGRRVRRKPSFDAADRRDEHSQAAGVDKVQRDESLGRGDFRKIPNGGPGVEDRLSMVYQGGVIERGFSLNKWVDICCTASAKLPKLCITPLGVPVEPDV